MIKRIPLLFLVALTVFGQASKKPKLVVAIVIDQFRYDYLTRFRQEYTGGLAKLLNEGAVFTNARYRQSPTVTAVGHSIIMTGAMPSVSGMVGNSWYDRETGKQVTSVCDWDQHIVGGRDEKPGTRCEDWDAASPNRLLVSTVGDEVRNAHEASRVIGMSLKARSAVLPSGHRANGAYWFDDSTGNFVSSTFYFAALPDWAKRFNEKKQAAKYVKQKWDGFDSWDFHATPGSLRPYEKIPASPWGNDILESFAEEALTGENLGNHGGTDVLTVSFSANDYVGHQVGPDSPEVRDMCLRTDKSIGKLLAAIDKQVGVANTIVVLSADHGVSPTPEVNQGHKMPGGYMFLDIEDVVRAALNRKFGEADWITASVYETMYFNWKVIDEKKISHHDVYNTVSDAILLTPQAHAFRIYNRDQLSSGVTGDDIAASMNFGFFPRRSGDLVVLLEPYWMGAMKEPAHTTHSTPFNYDTHVPVIFMGPGIKAGRYNRNIAVNDIAPTLATMLDVEIPSGSSGRVLDEMLMAQ